MKKKVLFLINTMGQAGAEVALIELLKKLDSKNEFQIYLYSIIPCGELFERVPDNIHLLNKHVSTSSVLSFKGRVKIGKQVLISFFYKFTGFSLLPYMIKNIKEQKARGGKIQYDKLLWRMLAQGRPSLKGRYDLAVSYIEGGANYFLADKVESDKKVSFVHIDYKQAGYTPYMDQGSYENMDRIYVVSKAVGEKFSSIYPQYKDKIRLFRNLLSREDILSKAERGRAFTDEFHGVRLVTVGRLHYQKGYDIAIEALARIIKDGYSVRWYIIGEGMERAHLEKLIRKNKVEDSFILMGKKDNPYPYVKQSDIYVHASRFEGKSIAIEEAQILGKAIIASDCTGNTEQIVDGYDGVLFPLSVENLVGEIKALIDNPQKIRMYEENVKTKELEHPEDLEDMLLLLD